MVTFLFTILFYKFLGSELPIIVAGDKLNNQETLLNIGEHIEIKKSIKDSKEKLLDSLFNIEENGATALGTFYIYFSHKKIIN